ncbi:hypothetical protein D5S17_06820 [Pseudonocardiaceae bacterium YIM PH 21723]|nr:hypothetical protein D5S17_06820 [Pseudonocardiaceae bacterium YIM PH 21723]
MSEQISDLPCDEIRDHLRQALRTGPFPAALHLAIEASGLTLDQIQLWLAERGARLSVPTLSYWRRGRSRPERAGSLRAVRLLENLFELPDGSLVSLLGPRRPRGRWLAHSPGGLEATKLFTGLNRDLQRGLTGSMAELTRMSTHITVTVDELRRTRSVHLRQVVRAAEDRVSRGLAVFMAEEEPDNPPTITALRCCRTGRIVVDRTTGLVMADLILDRLLSQGDPAILEYEWRFSPGLPSTRYEHRLLVPLREFVLEARFAPGVVPIECHRYDRRTATGEPQNQRELWIGGTNSAILGAWDVPAGIIGMNWTWPD